MLTIFNSKVLYQGCDQTEFNKIRDYLDDKKIKYKYRVKNRLSEWSRRGTVRGNLGSFGNPTNLMYEYTIVVTKKDFLNIHI